MQSLVIIYSVGVHFHSPNSAHPNLEDAVRYVEHRVGLAEEGQVEVVGPRVEDVPGGAQFNSKLLA